MPTVTALRARMAGRVAVELDGRPWRVVPLEAALTAGLDVGQELDRQRARLLRRELLRLRTIDVASSALRRQDLSATKLAERLGRVSGAPRATTLAERGYGNTAIDADLESKGIAAAIRADAIRALPPELERLGPIVERRGTGPRTARFAARRGFGEEAIDAAAGVGFANDT